MPTADKTTAHYARIGRKGGRAKSPAKSHAARLAALGHKLDECGTEPLCLLMCGGAALNISGLLTRLTADVDVLGAMHANGELGEMPDWIYPLAAGVAEEESMLR
jgi:hypothetical protein